jgi:RNA polymerase sigma factor (sigma-70 family)
MTNHARVAIAYDRRRSWVGRSLVMADQDRANERFGEVVLPHLADALALARWLTNSRQDAEDVVQDACVRALQNIDAYRGPNARAWVLAIVRNTCFNWLAKHRPKTLVMVGDMTAVDEVAHAQPDAHSPSPETELIRKAELATVEASIAALPHLYREVLILRDLNGLSYKEIADMLAVPIGTVMSRLARARAALAAAVVRQNDV